MFYHSMKDLCNGLIKKGYIQSKSVYNALIQVDRADLPQDFLIKIVHSQ